MLGERSKGKTGLLTSGVDSGSRDGAHVLRELFNVCERYTIKALPTFVDGFRPLLSRQGKVLPACSRDELDAKAYSTQGCCKA